MENPRLTVLSQHASDPITAPRFRGRNHSAIKEHVTRFFASGTGGPESLSYSGRSMPATHANKNIGKEEFYTVVDHVLDAMVDHGYAQRERDEVLAILYSLKNDVMGK